MAASDLYQLVESASVEMATSKPAMESVLAAWQRLGLDQGADQTYQNDLLEARQLLHQSPDLPTFLSALRPVQSQTMDSPLTSQPTKQSEPEQRRQSPFSQSRGGHGKSSTPSSVGTSRPQFGPRRGTRTR